MKLKKFCKRAVVHSATYEPFRLPTKEELELDGSIRGGHGEKEWYHGELTAIRDEAVYMALFAKAKGGA